MSWDSFVGFAGVSGVCWMLGTWLAFRNRRAGAIGVSALGSIVFLVFIIGLWMALERPPLRTMGETRLWYSFFLSVVGIGLYAKCRYQWMLGFSTLMSLVFVLINLLKPEIHSKALMPALQSPWFVPHVIVYMFSYAMLGASTLFAIYLWFRKSPTEVSGREMTVCDNLVRIGWAFLSLGMTKGALRARTDSSILLSSTPRRRSSSDSIIPIPPARISYSRKTSLRRLLYCDISLYSPSAVSAYGVSRSSRIAPALTPPS